MLKGRCILNKKNFSNPQGNINTLEGFRNQNKHYFEYLIKYKSWLSDIKDPIKNKILSVLLEVDNGIFTIGIPNWENGFNTVTKENLVNFLINNEFECDLSYASCDMTMLVVKFNDLHITTEINEYWEHYDTNKEFDTFEIYLNFKDFIKLDGIGCDKAVDHIKKEINFINETHKYYISFIEQNKFIKQD